MKRIPISKRLITLGRLLKQTGTWHILASYIVFVFIAALIVFLTEPEITSYGDALWYCYDVISTTGFGDVVVHGFIAKLCSVVVTVYSLIVIAIITGLFANFYMQVIEERRQGTLAAFLDKIERLPEMTPEELKELSEEVKVYRNGEK
ncbi:MAG: two pore domain potassium channel family protein [Lachnospiraceae bacterium]|nr:two pore domain potassium channel family protein [Lachnospiraceae bacterium]